MSIKPNPPAELYHKVLILWNTHYWCSTMKTIFVLMLFRFVSDWMANAEISISSGWMLKHMRSSWWFSLNWICLVTIAVYSRPFDLMFNCLLSVAALCVICIITSDWSGLQCFQKQTFSDESLRFRSHSVSAPGTKKILASVIAAAPLIFTLPS